MVLSKMYLELYGPSSSRNMASVPSYTDEPYHLPVEEAHTDIPTQSASDDILLTWLDSTHKLWKDRLRNPEIPNWAALRDAVGEETRRHKRNQLSSELSELQESRQSIYDLAGNAIRTKNGHLKQNDIVALIWGILFVVIQRALESNWEIRSLTRMITFLDRSIPDLKGFDEDLLRLRALQAPLVDILDTYLMFHRQVYEWIGKSFLEALTPFTRSTNGNLGEERVETDIVIWRKLDIAVGEFKDRKKKFIDLHEAMKQAISTRDQKQVSHIEFKPIPKDARKDGSFGWVEFVQEKTVGQKFAVKRLKTGSGYITTDSMVQNEIRVMQKLRHHHIATLVFSTYTGSEWGLYIQPLAKFDLGHYLDSTAMPPKKDRLFQWMACLINALDYAHSLDIAHYDIKPTNILVDKCGSKYNVLLTDFGLSRDHAKAKLNGNPTNDSRNGSEDLSTDDSNGILTDISEKTALDNRHNFGTLKYLAPESERSLAFDVFSMGCVHAEMVAVMYGMSRKDFDHDRDSRWGYVEFRKTIAELSDWLKQREKDFPEHREFLLLAQGMVREKEDRYTAKAAKAQLSGLGNPEYCRACSEA